MAPAKPNEIQITRLYDAPVAAVWDAWTDPAQVAKWWGPRGFTLTTHSKDLRPGGHWAYTMHGPDGTNWENKTVYFEVEPQAKLVYDHGGNDDRPPLFRVTVLFSEVGGKTKMEMTMAFASPEVCVEMGKFIKKASGDSTWDRLAEYLDKESTGNESFVINRAFPAPLDVLFKMWTDPQHLAKWLPPTGVEMKLLRSEIKPGGTSFYYMTNNAGLEFYGRIHYLQIQSPDFLQYTQEFCDKDEQLARHPLAPTWPPAMHTTVQLTAESPQRTRVTVTWRPHGNTTADELATFIAARAGMTQGWTGSFDKLEELLS